MLLGKVSSLISDIEEDTNSICGIRFQPTWLTAWADKQPGLHDTRQPNEQCNDMEQLSEELLYA